MAMPLTPHGAILLHVIHNFITDLEDKPSSKTGTTPVDFTGFGQFVHGIQGIIGGFESAFEISDRHSDFRGFGSAEGGGQFRAANSRASGEAYGFRVFTQIHALIKKSIHPAVEFERVLVNARLSEMLKFRVIILDFLNDFFAEKLIGLGEKIHDFLRIVTSFGKNIPPHLLGDYLIAIGIVHIFLKELKIFFGITILLLQEALPDIFVPNLTGGKIVFVRHYIERLIQVGTLCKGFFNLKTELSTGSRDIVTFFSAQSGFRAGMAKDGKEVFLSILLGTHPWQSFDGIVGDQVHLGADTPGLPGQKTGLLGGVIDVADQNILESDSLFFKAGVVLAGSEQFLDRIFFVHGHDA